jgi:nitrogenase-stabilizing/protective protein
MQTTKDFEKITDAEDFFHFFDISFDERILNVKRFHILKLFGNLIKDASDFDNDKKMAFYKFSLLKVYGDFASGASPSAADVFKMFEKTGGCLSCATTTCTTTSSCDTALNFNEEVAL